MPRPWLSSKWMLHWSSMSSFIRQYKIILCILAAASFSWTTENCSLLKLVSSQGESPLGMPWFHSRKTIYWIYHKDPFFTVLAAQANIARKKRNPHWEAPLYWQLTWRWLLPSSISAFSNFISWSSSICHFETGKRTLLQSHTLFQPCNWSWWKGIHNGKGAFTASPALCISFVCKEVRFLW